jgi:hypothetical protein
LTFCKACFILALKNLYAGGAPVKGGKNMNFRTLFTVSNKVLLFNLVTSSILFVGYFVFNPFDARISLGIAKSGNYNASTVDSLKSFATIAWTAYISGIIQFVLCALLSRIKRNSDLFENNIVTESVLIALAFVNITIILFCLIIYFFFLVPAGLIFFASIIIVFFLALTFALFSRFSNPGKEVKHSLLKRIDTRLLKFNFIYHRAIGLASLGFAVACGMSTHSYQAGQNYLLTTLNIIGFLVGMTGIIYLLLGRHYSLKKMDELQRVIQLEQSNFVLNFLFLFLYGAILLAANFHIEIRATNAIIYFGPIIIISLLLAESKYK